MKKPLALAASSIVFALLIVLLVNGRSAIPRDEPLIVETPAPADIERLAVEDLEMPTGPGQRTASAERADDEADDASLESPLDWVVRGRVSLSDGAAGELPIVRLRLAAHDGAVASGEPFASAVIESAADGTLAWPLRDPQRTVSITAELFDVPGYSASVRRHYLAVAREGPVESIRVLVNPRDAWVEGTVRASAAAETPGAPIEGARIVYNEAETVSDVRGAFRMAVPSRGYGALIATADGFHRGGETPGGLRSGLTTHVDIALDPEFGPEGTVFGYVRDARGGVLADARVHCGGSREGTVQTDATGYYELHGIKLHLDGSSVVVASCDGRAAQEKYVRAAADGAHLEAGTQLDFELVAGSRIDGVVMDFGGEPVRGAKVWIGPHPDLVANRRVHSDDDGVFAFEHVAPGRTFLGVEKKGQPGHIETVVVAEDGEPLRVSIRLARASILRGRVTDADGVPVDRVIVRARKAAAERTVGMTAVTGADGLYEIAGVPDGEVEVAAWRHGVIRQTVSHVHDGRQLDLVVERATRISGRVVDALTGRPIETFVVRLELPEDESLRPWFSGIDFSWVMGGRSFSAVDGRWSSDEKDPIRRGAWTLVVVEAEGYKTLRMGPVQVSLDDPPEEWLHELERDG